MIRDLVELAKLFLKLGTVSFGGPAAHAATMEHEVVQRRGWLTHEEFLDLFGVANLIPGPNSTEMAAFIGHRRAGRLGALVAGTCFIVPAALITGLLAWSYCLSRTLPAIEPIYRGIPPAVVAILITAVWRLGRKPLSTWPSALIGVGVAAGSLLGADQVLVFLVGSALGAMLLFLARRQRPPSVAGVVVGLSSSGLAIGSVAAGTATVAAAVVPLWKIALFFLKVGAVLYGTGYVLIAYLQGGLVDQNHWLTQKELDVAVAVGQFTPGPLLSTATFVGFLLHGTSGAAVATFAIFAPSFLLVMLTAPLVARLRQSRWTATLLDAANASSIGLMIAVTVNLAWKLPGWPSYLIALVATLVAARWRVAPAWLVLGGIVAGLVLSRLT